MSPPCKMHRWAQKWSDFQSKTTIGKLWKSTIQKCWCTQIACGPNLRNFQQRNTTVSRGHPMGIEGIPWATSEEWKSLLSNVVCYQWPTRALVFELVAPPPRNKLKLGPCILAWWNIETVLPLIYLTCGKVAFCSDSGAMGLKKYGHLETDWWTNICSVHNFIYTHVYTIKTWER